MSRFTQNRAVRSSLALVAVAVGLSVTAIAASASAAPYQPAKLQVAPIDLHLNQSGPEAAALYSMFQQRGITLPDIYGTYGIKDAVIVEAIQREAGLSASTTINRATWQALANKFESKIADNHPKATNVAALQAVVTKGSSGYYRATISGLQGYDYFWAMNLSAHRLYKMAEVNANGTATINFGLGDFVAQHNVLEFWATKGQTNASEPLIKYTARSYMTILMPNDYPLRYDGK